MGTASLKDLKKEIELGESNLRKIWKKFDKDGSGTLENKEIKKFFKTLFDEYSMYSFLETPQQKKKTIKEWIRYFDADQDGKISFEEFSHALKVLSKGVILVVGPPLSGKSTFCRFMRHQEGDSNFDNILNTTTALHGIYHHLACALSAIVSILTARGELVDAHAMQVISQWSQFYAFAVPGQPIPSDPKLFLQAAWVLWQDSKVSKEAQSIISMDIAMPNIDTAPYFLGNINSILTGNYYPTEIDLLHLHQTSEKLFPLRLGNALFSALEITIPVDDPEYTFDHPLLSFAVGLIFIASATDSKNSCKALEIVAKAPPGVVKEKKLSLLLLVNKRDIVENRSKSKNEKFSNLIEQSKTELSVCISYGSWVKQSGVMSIELIDTTSSINKVIKDTLATSLEGNFYTKLKSSSK